MALAMGVAPIPFLEYWNLFKVGGAVHEMGLLAVC